MSQAGPKSPDYHTPVFTLEVWGAPAELIIKELGNKFIPYMKDAMGYLVGGFLWARVIDEMENLGAVHTRAMQRALDHSVEARKLPGREEVIGRLFNNVVAHDSRGRPGYYAIPQHEGFRKWVPFSVSPRLLEWAIEKGFRVVPTRGGYRPPGMWVGRGKGKGRPFMKSVVDRKGYEGVLYLVRHLGKMIEESTYRAPHWSRLV